jgi:hypothetical protein
MAQLLKKEILTWLYPIIVISIIMLVAILYLTNYNASNFKSNILSFITVIYSIAIIAAVIGLFISNKKHKYYIKEDGVAKPNKLYWLYVFSLIAAIILLFTSLKLLVFGLIALILSLLVSLWNWNQHREIVTEIRWWKKGIIKLLSPAILAFMCVLISFSIIQSNNETSSVLLSRALVTYHKHDKIAA